MPPLTRTRTTATVPLAAGDSLPLPGRHVALSAFDTCWIGLPPIRRVLLFPAPAAPFPAVAAALRSALARTLPFFHPFAGALTYSLSSRTVGITCSADDAGVAFVEAETDLDFGRLVMDEEHDVEALMQLVPDIRRDALPAPVMAVQVTEFVRGGGVGVGVSVHHAATDGRGLWRFFEMWATTAADVGVAEGPSPLHDRKMVWFEGGEELAGEFLRLAAPDLPMIAQKQDSVPERRRPLSRRTFTFHAPTVRCLKQLLAATNAGKPPSTFATLATHAWVSIAQASGFTDDSPVFAVIPADCRAYMSPPADGAYSGNCVAVCIAALRGSELTGPDGLAWAFLVIREIIQQVKEQPLKDCDLWLTKFAAIPPGRAVVLVGSPWFPAYAIDFGFGRPARTELVSMNHDGELVLVTGREAGSVQASVAIAAEKLPAFCEVFVAGHGSV